MLTQHEKAQLEKLRAIAQEDLTPEQTVELKRLEKKAAEAEK